MVRILNFIFLLYAVGSVSGAVIHGTVYEWYTLEPLQNVILEVNSTPPQRFVAKEGTYEFELERGQYCIKSRYYENNELLYYSEENVSIETDGDFVLDIIMFPNIDLNEKFFEDFDINLSINEDLLEGIDGDREEELPTWGIIAIIIIPLILLYLLKFRRGSKEEGKKPTEVLPDDLKEIVNILRRHGGRMTQLELRKELNYSEAKVSLMLADLENRGLIERFRRGRGNIIILKKT